MAEVQASAPDIPEARAVSLEEALRYAEAHHPRILALQGRVRGALADAEVPAAGWLPRVGAMAQLVGSTTNNSTTTLLSTDAVDLPRIGATPLRERPDLTPEASSAVAVGARQQLFDFGRIAAQTASARLLAEVERHRVTNEKLDVRVAVAQAFYAVLAARAVLEASLQAQRRATVHREFARAGVRAGMRPAIELTRAEADAARFEVGVLRAVGGLRVARTVLASACGAEEDELDARGEAPELGPLPPLSELSAQSAAREPAILIADAQAKAQKALTREIETERRPRLYATASVSGRAGGAEPSNGPTPWGNGLVPVVPNWNAGVVLTWPLYDPAIARRHAASQTRERAAEAAAAAARRANRERVGRAYHEADVAQRAVSAVERATQAARVNYRHVEQRFRVGLGTSTELADAEALLTEAEIQLAIATFQAAQSRAVLARAVAEEP